MSKPNHTNRRKLDSPTATATVVSGHAWHVVNTLSADWVSRVPGVRALVPFNISELATYIEGSVRRLRDDVGPHIAASDVGPHIAASDVGPHLAASECCLFGYIRTVRELISKQKQPNKITRNVTYVCIRIRDQLVPPPIVCRCTTSGSTTTMRFRCATSPRSRSFWRPITWIFLCGGSGAAGVPCT